MKVDRSFVSRIGADGQGSEMVGAIVSLARNLGMDAVAEGVETAGQLAQLASLGCEYAQGFFFSKAVDGQAAGELIAAQPWDPRSRGVSVHRPISEDAVPAGAV